MLATRTVQTHHNSLGLVSTKGRKSGAGNAGIGKTWSTPHAGPTAGMGVSEFNRSVQHRLYAAPNARARQSIVLVISLFRLVLGATAGRDQAER